jgi:hypothetical protein
MVDDKRPRLGPLLTSVLSGNRSAGELAIALHVGGVISGEGYLNGSQWNVNGLLPKIAAFSS